MRSSNDGIMSPAIESRAEPIADALPIGLRVLVVDDNAFNRMVLSEMLARLGITPRLASDGAEAVKIAAEDDFDLILMDIQMPVLDGLNATRQIRNAEQDRARGRTPVLAFTSTSADPLLLTASGMDGVLAKPCELGALHQCLATWCHSRGENEDGLNCDGQRERCAADAAFVDHAATQQYWVRRRSRVHAG